MPSNIEIKARVPDMEGLRRAVEAAGASFAGDCHQEDVFFRTAQGRLKLRVAAGDAELIHYERADTAGPKTSSYRLCPVPEPDRLRGLLAAALGVRGVVRKRRTLYRLGATRIHLDRVEGLGSFMELEVVLAPGQAPEEGRATAFNLMARLGIEREDLVSGAYLDLLEGCCPPERGA